MRAPDLDELQLLCADAGQKLRKLYFSSPEVRRTAVNDVYTLIENRIRLRHPKLPIFARFSGTGTRARDPGDYWLLADELNGAAAFKLMTPAFAVSMTLMKGSLPCRSVIADPCNERIYAAEQSHGAYLNSEPTFIPLGHSPGRPVVGAVLPERSQTRDRLPDAAWNILSDLRKTDCTVHVADSITLLAARIASGEIDATVFFGGDLLDAAPCHLIVKEARGVVSDLDGRALNYNRDRVFGHIFARDRELHERIKMIAARHLPST